MKRWTWRSTPTPGRRARAPGGQSAARLACWHLDTGAMSRLRWKALREGATRGTIRVAALARAVVDVRYENGAHRTLIRRNRRNSLLRTRDQHGRQHVSKFSACACGWCACSRRGAAAVDDPRRAIRPLVCGRDAEIYLTASPEVRARRRYDELRPRRPAAYGRCWRSAQARSSGFTRPSIR